MSVEGTALTFKYDHNGLRTRKVVQTDWLPETTNYFLHGKLLTHMTVDYTDFDEVAHTDKLHFFYDAQSRPAQVNFNGVIYTYIHNLQGDIVGLLDNTGALVVEYKYDAWGKPISVTGNLADTLGKRSPFRYRGYVYDEETGLYYLRSRYYNPTVGRFVNADTRLGNVGELGSHNMYAYCANMPVFSADPDGQEAVDAARDIFYTLSAVDGALPIGDALGLLILVGAYAYDKLKANANSKSAAKSVSTATSVSDSTTNPDKKYYLAIAYGNASPVPVSPAMTAKEVCAVLRTTSAASNVAKYVANSSYSDVSKYVYGVFTYSSKDAYNLAKRFNDSNPRLDLQDGSKYKHYNVVTPAFKDIHFWFFI